MNDTAYQCPCGTTHMSDRSMLNCVEVVLSHRCAQIFDKLIIKVKY